MFKNIYKNLIENNIELKNKRIVLGFSGGGDSTLLFHFLLWLKEKENIFFKIMHLNHKEREEADFEEAFVKRQCEKYKIPFSLYTENIYEKNEIKQMGFEMTARIYRLKYFEKELKLINGDYVFTAHNMNDRIETMFINMERGAGLRGLVSLKLKNGKYIKPLIHIKKERILDYLNKHNIEYIYDKTNADTYFARNRIRHNIIKHIDKHLKGGIKTIDKLLDRLEETDNLLNILINKNVKFDIKKDNIIIDISQLLLYNNKMLKLLLYYTITPHYYVNENIINEIVKMIYSSKAYIKSVFKCFVCIKDYNKLIISKSDIKERSEDKIEINEGEGIKWGKYNISFNRVNKFDFNNKNAVYFPLSIGNSIIIRARKNGDRFIPFGNNHYIKLSKFFIKQKISKNIRDNIPIVLSKNGEILWIMGIRRTDKYKLKDEKEFYEIKGA